MMRNPEDTKRRAMLQRLPELTRIVRAYLLSHCCQRDAVLPTAAFCFVQLTWLSTVASQVSIDLAGVRSWGNGGILYNTHCYTDLKEVARKALASLTQVTAGYSLGSIWSHMPGC